MKQKTPLNNRHTSRRFVVQSTAQQRQRRNFPSDSKKKKKKKKKMLAPANVQAWRTFEKGVAELSKRGGPVLKRGGAPRLNVCAENTGHANSVHTRTRVC